MDQNLDMPGYDPSLPGELNEFASPDSDLCLEYNIVGMYDSSWRLIKSCQHEQLGQQCHLRHLSECHPDRIALLYRYGRLTEFEADAWLLHPCEAMEVNPFANPKEKLCYDYLNGQVCKRNMEGKICRFRHCLPAHKDAVYDKLKHSKK